MVLADFPPPATQKDFPPFRTDAAQVSPGVPHPTKIAVAIGAGFSKAFNGVNFYRLRSLITESIPANLKANQLHVSIKNSVFSAEFGSFAVGENLDSLGSSQSLKDGLKAKWYAPLTLAVLAELAPQEMSLFNVDLTCSIPTPNMAAEIRRLQGLHDVTVNGKELTINIVSVRPVPEGLGSAVYLAQGQPIAVVDFGYQNTTVAAYDPQSRQMLGMESLKHGVGKLFEEIAELANTTGERPSAEQIRLGVEAGTFELDGYSGISFKQAYDDAFEPWMKARINDAKTQAGHVFGRCPAKFFAGGGSLLPGVADVARKLNVGICSGNPQEIEVKGIYRI
ncbi:MAG: hypothetical protein AAFV72_00075 [Cyanobacteria bacterium J06635_1]